MKKSDKNIGYIIKLVLLRLFIVSLISLHPWMPEALRAEENVLIKFGTIAPEGSTWMRIMHRLIDR